MPRLADTRKLTLDDARSIFEALARAQIRVWKRQAACEDRMAGLKSRLEAENAEDLNAIAAAAGELKDFILANKDQFQKPRKIKTPFGAFGLETEKELEIEDVEALIQELLVRGYEDCLKTVRAVLKTPLGARLKAGETFPGCRTLEGDVAKYKVDRSLLDEVEVTAAAAAEQ